MKPIACAIPIQTIVPLQDLAANRQLFLTGQGYKYAIEDAEALSLLPRDEPVLRD